MVSHWYVEYRPVRHHGAPADRSGMAQAGATVKVLVEQWGCEVGHYGPVSAVGSLHSPFSIFCAHTVVRNNIMTQEVGLCIQAGRKSI